jgi:hypothetical protein
MNRIIGYQKSLFGGGEVPVWSKTGGTPPKARARARDPGPSHDAAAGVDVAGVADQIRKCLQRFGPQTSHEIASRTGLALVTVSPRMKPLRLDGVVRDSGGRRDRRTVWELVR